MPLSSVGPVESSYLEQTEIIMIGVNGVFFLKRTKVKVQILEKRRN